jgi:RNAse (barnase) inhibitor barstar
MTTDKPFLFGAPAYNTNEVFYARLTGEIYKKEQLFKALFYLLWFPGYFGFNWDALYDCLRNLDWIKEKVVVLVHAGLPKLPEQELKIYLDLLRDAVQKRGPDEPNRLEVVFDEADRERVVKLLS